MTSKLPRRGSFSAFTWQGKLPIDPHATSFANEFAAALACCRFRYACTWLPKSARGARHCRRANGAK